MCFKTKLELDGSEHLELPIVLRGIYVRVPGVYLVESLSPVATDCSTQMIIESILYFWKNLVGCIKLWILKQLFWNSS